VLGNFFLLPRGEAVLTKVAELVAVERDVAARWAKIVPSTLRSAWRAYQGHYMELPQ
jgi:hypothetical protein